MAYFNFLPNVYVGEGVKDDEPFKYRLAKNISRRIKVREDLEKYVTFFETYSLRDGETPAMVAEVALGDPFLDWVVLLTNNITDFYAQWPMNESDLQTMGVDKYGYAEAPHHYETKEIRDSQNRLIISKGNRVDPDFSVTYYDNGSYVTKSDVTGISNYEHEVKENIGKSTISILKRSYLQQFLSDMKKEMTYKRSSQFVSNNLIRTENTKLTN